MYSHGGNIYDNCIQFDFSVNVNPLGTPAHVMERMHEALHRVHQYPQEYSAGLKKAIAAYEQVGEKQIICGNGACELLYELVKNVHPKRAMVLQPTFLEYEKALSQCDCVLTCFEWKEEEMFSFNKTWLNRFCIQMQEQYDLIFLANPNNPTGTVLKKEVLESILNALPEKTMLVVDESFLDFTEMVSVKSFAKEKNNVFIIKSLTKTFSIPGVRLGYGICSNEKLLEQMDERRQCWSVSLIAQEAGIAILESRDDYSPENFLRQSKEYIKSERTFVEQELRQLGILVIPGEGNFILFRMADEYLYVKMMERGILIRKCENFRGLSKNFYRIAVKTHPENRMLIETLKEILHG